MHRGRSPAALESGRDKVPDRAPAADPGGPFLYPMKTQPRLVPLSVAAVLLAVLVSPGLSAAERLSAGLSPANAAILVYLGEPVPPPARLDPKYTADGLTVAFRQMCRNVGVRVKQLAVDTSEFPFLVQGLVDGRQDVTTFKEAIHSVTGYSYGGSASKGGADGTWFVLNLTPSAHYPRNHAEPIRRRSMIRLQVLLAALTDPGPPSTAADAVRLQDAARLPKLPLSLPGAEANQRVDPGAPVIRRDSSSR
jgi:hypothetical protein